MRAAEHTTTRVALLVSTGDTAFRRPHRACRHDDAKCRPRPGRRGPTPRARAYGATSAGQTSETRTVDWAGEAHPARLGLGR